MAILAGGREQVSDYYYGLGYYDSVPARFLLRTRWAKPCYRCSARRQVPVAGIGAGRLDAAAPLG